MNPERKEFLTLKTLSARLTVEETACFLGFSLHDVPILVSAGLLKPLGHPCHNAPKYFATTTLESLRSDLKWLAKACDAIVCYWRKKNTPKSDGEGDEEASAAVTASNNDSGIGHGQSKSTCRNGRHEFAGS